MVRSAPAVAILLASCALGGCGTGALPAGGGAQGASTTAAEPAAQVADEPGAGTVVSITDGDTLRIRLSGVEEKVRLIGIDTPETHGRGGLRECFGEEATAGLEALLPPGTPVRVERDDEARDRYGRLLAYVHRRSDGLFVNLEMAEQGFADVLTIRPNDTYEAQLSAAVAEARRAGRGLWSACGSADVPLPRR